MYPSFLNKRLAALVPKSRANLTRFHGGFVPNSKHRALVTPVKWGKGTKLRVSDTQSRTPGERLRAQRPHGHARLLILRGQLPVGSLTLSVGWDRRELLDQTHHKGKDALDNYRDAVPIRMDSIALV